MLVTYEHLPELHRDELCQQHPWGTKIVKAIELDLSRDPCGRARQLSNGRWAKVFEPPVAPAIEVRLAYLVGDNVLIKIFKWVSLE